MGADEWNGDIPGVYFTGTPVSGYAPLEVVFTDRSFSQSGILSWLWEFGDGETSEEQDPVHVYAEPGDYTVSLSADDSRGGLDTAELVVSVTVVAVVPAAVPAVSLALVRVRTYLSPRIHIC